MNNYLVVGASSGIGKALTEVLTSGGNQVFGTYFQHEIAGASPGVKSFYLNVLDETLDFTDLPETLHGFAYCPGAINLKPFTRVKPEDFITDYRIQTLGAIKVLQEILPRLKNAEQASVILFSTVAVGTGFPYHSLVSSSKGALEGLTKALAAELAPRIRVNCIAPSLTDTPLSAKLLGSEEKKEANAQRHPLKRIGAVDDLAQMAGFLLSDKASWVTGQIFGIDGGISTVRTG